MKLNKTQTKWIKEALSDAIMYETSVIEAYTSGVFGELPKESKSYVKKCKLWIKNYKKTLSELENKE